MVRRTDPTLLSEAIAAGEQRIKEKLGLEAKFKVEAWPGFGTADVPEDGDESLIDEADDHMVEPLSQYKFLMESGEPLHPVSNAGAFQCISTCLPSLFPGVNSDSLPVIEQIPTYRELLEALPMISSMWGKSIDTGKKYLVHVLCHCIGLDVGEEHIDCWDANYTRGVRFRGYEKETLLQVLEKFFPCLEVSLSTDMQANAPMSVDLGDPLYNQRAGAPNPFPGDLLTPPPPLPTTLAGSGGSAGSQKLIPNHENSLRF